MQGRPTSPLSGARPGSPGSSARTGPLRAHLALFLVALAVRLAVLSGLAASPGFAHPFLDAADYDELARALLTGRPSSTPLFWQPVLYPLVLAAIYALSGGSILAARVCQALVGALACVLTRRLTASVFDERAGKLAGYLQAFYGPLVYFELELVAAGWTAFWATLFLVLLVRRGPPRRGADVALGATGALALLARPVFLPVLALALAVFAWRRARAGMAARLAAAAAGLVLVLVPAGFLRSRSTGSFGVLPATGGINFYIGNNPDWRDTVALRAGDGWTELATRPKRAGAAGGMWGEEAYFYECGLAYARGEPGAFASGLVAKAVQFFSPRELPRSYDVYTYREWSPLLGALVFRVGGFGAPFGLLLALATIGLVRRGREVPPEMWSLALYPLLVILYFPAARYRVPVLPVFLMLGAAGVLELAGSWRGCGRRKGALLAAALAPPLLLARAGPFPQERGDFRAELHSLVGSKLWRQGRPDEARAIFEAGLEKSPEDPDLLAKLGECFVARGDLARAIATYERAVRAAPGRADVHGQLGAALLARGDVDAALRHLATAVELDAHSFEAWLDLGVARQRSGDPARAIECYERACALRPGDPSALQNLTVALVEAGRLADAIARLERAVAERPEHAQLRYLLAHARAQGGDVAGARAELERLLELEPAHARARQLLRQLEPPR